MTQALLQKRMHLVALTALLAMVAALFAIAGTQAQAANKIVFNDSDAVVKAGTDVGVKLVANAENYSDNGQAVDRWHVSGAGELVFQDTAGTITTEDNPTIVTTGAPTGEYTVTARTGTSPNFVNYTATLRVGEAGVPVSMAELTFNKHHTATGGTFTCGPAPAPATAGSPTADEIAQKASEATDTDTATAGASATSGICLVLNVENSLGNKPLDSSVTRVTVISPGASADDRTTASDTQVFDSTTTPAAGASTPFRVQKATSGTIDVYAIVFGSGGAVATSNTLTLKFSGGPDAIMAGDEIGSLIAPSAAGGANTGSSYVEVMATDKSGATVSVASGAGATDNLILDQADITVKITDSEDTNVTSKFAITYAVRATADDTATAAVDESKISRNALAVVVAPGAAPGVAGGTYTMEVTLGIGSKNAVESDLHVVGPLASIIVTADKTTVAVGDVVVVTATLTDANGLPVADGKADVAASGEGDSAVAAQDNSGDDVVFTTAGALKLVGFGADANGQVTREVKNGTASATYVVTQGSGTAIVLANVKSPAKTGSVSISTTAPQVVQAEEGPGPVASISLEAPDQVASGDTLMVTATVTDANGDSVADGTVVTFATGGDLSLTLYSQSGSTVNGQASVTYMVGGGYGTSTITASSSGVIATTMVSKPMPEPMPEPEPEPAPATLASASASASAETTSVGDSVDVTITATDSEGNTAADDLIAAVIVSANGTLVPAMAMGEQTVSVSCASSGDLSVSVRVVGKDGSQQTASVSVTCLGDAASLTLGDPSGNLSQIGDDSVTIEVTGAADENGNAVAIPSDLEASVSGEGVMASVEGTTVTVSSSGTAAAKVAAGDYTVTVSSGDASAEATVTVDAEAGPPAALSVSADASEVSDGDLLTVTASVSDAGGDAVTDGTSVTFTAGGAVTLVMINSTATSGGDATATYIVGAGDGTATVYAVAGAASDSVSVMTPAPVVEPEPEPEPEPEVHDASGLSSQTLNSFTSWSASNSTDASKILASLAGRGAKAILLWNGSAWLRYSMVDGAMVPGSIDFTINPGDVLYIVG